MHNSRTSTYKWTSLVVASLLAVAVAGCNSSSSGGGDNAAPPSGGGGGTAPTVLPPTGTAPVDVSTLTPTQFQALTPAVPAVAITIASPPKVTFSLTDGKGNGLIGFGSKSQSATATLPGYPNLAFALAKLVPGVGTAPSRWVSYIVTTVPTKNATTGAITAAAPTRPTTDNTGTLVDNKNGTYTYTFYRDITTVKTQVAGMTVTAPNNIADLDDLTYDPTLVHRLTIQISGNVPGTSTNIRRGNHGRF